MKGQGCPECGKEYARNFHKNEWEKYLINIKTRHGEHYSYPKIQEEYINSHSEITVHCNICGNTFTKIACDHMTSKEGGCKECFKKEKEKLRSYSYENLLEHKPIELQIMPFKGVKSYKEKIIAICPIHNEYEIKIQSLLKGKCHCKKCIITEESKRKSLIYKENFTEKLNALTNGKCSPYMDTFVNSKTEMSFHCNVCGLDYKRIPNNIFSKKIEQPCLHCITEEQRLKRTKTTEQFIQDAVEIYGKNKYDYSITEYYGSDKKVKIKCNDCGRFFEIEANSHLQGNGCPYHYHNKSTYEEEIKNILNEHGINCITNDRIILNGNELDIYIPSHKIAIEIDGIFWHNELYKNYDYHINKTRKCEEKEIHLIHIFEDEWIENRELCLSTIFNYLKLDIKTIYANNCEIKKLKSKIASDFLNKNHLQGTCRSQIKIGLFYNNELVSVMTFGNFNSKESSYELLRFCNKVNINVINSANMLFQYFIKNYNPCSVISYVDRRWDDGSNQKKLGFIQINETNPDYFYVIQNKRQNKLNYRKNILIKKYGCPLEMSEKEFCKTQKWYRIYDCGKIIFIKNF